MNNKFLTAIAWLLGGMAGLFWFQYTKDKPILILVTVGLMATYWLPKKGEVDIK